MQDFIESVIEEYYPGADDPGCAAMIVQGDAMWVASRGLANLDTQAAIDSKTNFRLASVSKQFTAACILKLRDQDSVRLDQPVTDFFPGFAEYGKRVTLEHLLRHTSGIKDYEKLLSPDLTVPVRDADVLDMLGREDAGDFEPGEAFRYSNSGYALLAMVVEAVSGKTFPNYLREEFFLPLGMQNTLAYVNGPGLPEPSNRAIGYKLTDDGHFEWSDQNVTTAVLGDGGIYCSADDYARWIRAYWGGEVLDPATVQQAWTPGVTTGGDVVPYGYGWRLEQYNDRWRPYHPGSTSGFRNGVVIDGKKQWAALVLSNRANGDAVSLAARLAERLESQ